MADDKAIVLPRPDEYQRWSKHQLIKRVLELEGRLPKEQLDPTNNKEAFGHSDVTKPQKLFDFSKYNTRFIALKFSYLGWNYNGLAIQTMKTPLPTVESVIIESLYKTRLIPSLDPKDFNFSRCGRTDKGVSALNQVISLNVRSSLTVEEQMNAANDKREIDYLHILNHSLPNDILVKSVSLRPPKNFDARFSCKHRHYRYIFYKSDLDIDLMNIAAKKYEGEHDFRNFCKVDGSKQITSFSRRIISSNIVSLDDEFYYFDLKGTAFLWHQVRCMIAILLLIGQKLEHPRIIDDLMDIEKYPSKPVYEMAYDIPLVLYDCVFEDIEWEDQKDPFKICKFADIVQNLWLNHALKYQIVNFVKKNITDDISPSTLLRRDTTKINVGDGRGKFIKKYRQLSSREFMDPVDVINERYRKRKRLE
ncbi:pseudouridine synthase DEG1 [Ascoidea rubescens DSM 1968]|uniref:tRNA pseudouridine synthase n=1 Tax=Ascoidea rubescens DSM 1968 TaxID=1344418 RepID=A0A1D2VRF9_9ASCO|nr:tRNA pseudouridine synthase [Ascoidea rubescens DSM 1968]ODV64194.1 tRNA pseudouridine synthase [Ascoidea rubescens DSM 1968]